MKRFTQWLGITVVSLTLGGCVAQQEPSDSEIRSAVEQSVRQNLNDVDRMVELNPETAHVADAFRMTVHGVHKLSCTDEGLRRFLCNVRVDVESAITGRAQNTVPLRMVRNRHHWRMSTGT